MLEDFEIGIVSLSQFFLGIIVVSLHLIQGSFVVPLHRPLGSRVVILQRLQSRLIIGCELCSLINVTASMHLEVLEHTHELRVAGQVR